MIAQFKGECGMWFRVPFDLGCIVMDLEPDGPERRPTPDTPPELVEKKFLSWLAHPSPSSAVTLEQIATAASDPHDWHMVFDDVYQTKYLALVMGMMRSKGFGVVHARTHEMVARCGSQATLLLWQLPDWSVVACMPGKPCRA